MKALIPTSLIGLLAIFVVAQKPAEDQLPPEAEAKITEALPQQAYAQPKKARKLLIFSKTNGFHHASIITGRLAFEKLGKQTGAFEAVVSNDLDNFEVDKLKTYDAVCFLNTTGNIFMPHSEEEKLMSEEEKNAARERSMRLRDNLDRFIKAGRGFIGIHSATDTLYEWEDYGKMIGGYFDGHPWGGGTHVSIKVEPGKAKHPIVAMFEGENVEFKEEIYQLRDPYDSSKVDMLLRLDLEKSDMDVKDIKRTDKDFGVAWVKSWGKGRVFYCSLGHNHDMYWHPKVIRHYLAGIQWALGDLKADVEN